MSNKQVVESTAGNRTTFSHLLHPLKLRQLAADWLAEDVPAFDYGGFVVGEKIETAVLLCKSPGVLAGALLSLVQFGLIFQHCYLSEGVVYLSRSLSTNYYEIAVYAEKLEGGDFIVFMSICIFLLCILLYYCIDVHFLYLNKDYLLTYLLIYRTCEQDHSESCEGTLVKFLTGPEVGVDTRNT